MKTTLENRKKVAINSPKIALKRKNKVEEGGASSLGMKREIQESTNVRAQKMMRSRMEPFVMPIVVQSMRIIVQAAQQTIEVPQMTSPHERQLRKQKQEVP